MKVMVVTGASSGVGKAIAERFARDGWPVCALARSEDKLEALAEAHESVEAYPTDVSDAAQVKRTFAAILDRHPRVDALVNNAGVTNDEHFGEADFTVIDRVIDTNLKGAMYCTYAVLPSMMEHREGRIINVASTAGIPGEHIAPPAGTVRFADYGASKFGLVGFADFMARDLRHYNIQMTTLCPGGIDTPIRGDGDEDASKLMRPEEVAKLVEFILEQRPNTLYKQVVFFPMCEWH